MTRTTPSTVVDLGLEDDEPYVGVLIAAAVEKSKNPAYPEDQLRVGWELRQGGKLTDFLSLKLGLQQATKAPSKLRQLLNALGEKPKDAEVWFDAATLEWGYEMTKADSPAYAVLTPGMAVTFKGEKRKQGDGTMRYKVTGYKALSGAKPKPKAEPPVDVDPDEVPF